MCIQELCMCVCAIHFLKRSRLMTQACSVCNSNKVIHMCCCCCFGGSSNSFSDNQIHDSMSIYSTTHRRHTYIIIVNIDDNYMGGQQNPYQHTHTHAHTWTYLVSSSGTHATQAKGNSIIGNYENLQNLQNYSDGNLWYSVLMPPFEWLYFVQNSMHFICFIFKVHFFYACFSVPALIVLFLFSVCSSQ